MTAPPEPGAPWLTVAGGGLTTVSTDGILDDAAELDRAGRELAHCADGLAAVHVPAVAAIGGGLGGIATAHARSAARAASRSVDAVAVLARELAGRLRSAAEAYGDAERSATASDELLGAFEGWRLGTMAPLLVADALILALLGAPVMALTGTSPSELERTVVRFLEEHQGVLADPRMVRLVRAAISSVDDAMLGAVAVPFPIARAWDDRESGRFGLHGATALIVAGGGIVGALRETPTTVHRTALPGSAAAPGGYADVAARIPPNSPGSPQIRIERYETGAGRPRFIAYFGGTIDPGFTAAGEPWDDTSNIQGVGRLDPGSVRAAQQALTAAGARPGDRVLSVGYSQGGIVATDIARGSGGFQSAGVITFGSPTDQVRLPADVPAVAVEHREDVVPALGGEPLAADQGGLQRTIVSRSALAGGPPPTEAFAGHHLDLYQRTAALMDGARDARITGMADRVAELTGGREAAVTVWRADRVEPQPPAPAVVNGRAR